MGSEGLVGELFLMHMIFFPVDVTDLVKLRVYT